MIDPKYYGDKPFYVCKDEFAPGKFRIKESVIAEKKLDPNGDLGFMDVAQARVLGLDYPVYMKFCEKNYGGRANESKHGWTSPVIRFENETLANSLCLLLNKRWGELFD